MVTVGDAWRLLLLVALGWVVAQPVFGTTMPQLGKKGSSVTCKGHNCRNIKAFTGTITGQNDI